MTQPDVQPPGSHFIKGAYLAGTGTRWANLNPATGEALTWMHEASEGEINAAVESAEEAFRVWRKMRPVERGRVLRRAADLLRARNRELSILESLDTGKPLQETLVADAASGADCLEYYAGLAADMTGERHTFGRDWAYTIREPLGVCAGIGAWNYPIQIACWKAAPALAAGNAMIFKPAPQTPLTALKLAEILVEAGAPPGLFNVVQGGGAVGAALTEHEGIAKISVTGSVPTGLKVMRGAADTLKAVTLELGGKSPLVIFEDADLESAIGGAMLGNFYSSGQVCSNGTRVFVQRPLLGRFIARLTERARLIRLGDPLDETTQMGPLISADQRDKVVAYMKAGAEEAQLLFGGGAARVKGLEGGYWVQPTAFLTEDDSASIVCEEIFGPVMTIIPFDDEEEAIARANATPYGLAAGVYTADMARAHRVSSEIDAGICWINAYNLTPVEVPFGGVRRSGLGRENGRAGLEGYTRIKTVYVGMGPTEAPY